MTASVRLASMLLGVAVAGCGEGDLSSVRQAALAASAPQDRPANQACGSRASYEYLKSAAFEKARFIHKQNVPALNALAAGAVGRMDMPIAKGSDEALNVTFCKARMVIDLPPGATDAFSGDRQLTADVEYRTQAAADGRMRVYPIGGLDQIAFRLAAIGLTSGSGVQTAAISPTDGGRVATVAMTSGSGRANPAPRAMPARAVLASNSSRPTTKAPVRASFNCRNARTRGQQIVCADGYLASLDRETRFLYNRAAASADRKERAKLQETGARFLARRERCKRWACIEDVYEDRIKQIERISRD